MLVGLSAKNGILIVEFANQLRDQGREIHEALIEAAGMKVIDTRGIAISPLQGFHLSEDTRLNYLLTAVKA